MAGNAPMMAAFWSFTSGRFQLRSQVFSRLVRATLESSSGGGVKPVECRPRGPENGF